MADLILEKDSLNAGRIKLNEAIQQSNEAKNESQSAVSTANQALSNSENTQTQLDTLVLNGDSSVEAAQARVDENGHAYTTLKERLDSKDIEFTTQLEENMKLKDNIVIDVTDKRFGAKGDGITDDTSSIQEAINSLGPNGGTVLFPSLSFLINGDISIPDKVKLFGNQAKIITNRTVTGTIFAASGTIDSVKYNLSQDALKGGTELSFTSLPSVSVGDALSITQTGTTADNSYYVDVVKVKSIDSINNKITIETPLMHDFHTSLTATAQKATLKSEITIDGFEFIINSSSDVNPIYLWCTEDTAVQNVKASGFGGNAIKIYSSLNFTIKNVIAKNPSNGNPGRGYAVMVHQGSAFGLISNVYGYKTRHTVDIAGGSHSISIVECVGVKNTTQTFALHGQHEKNITFEGCKDIASVSGGFTIGNSSYGRSEEVNLINCTSYFSNIGFNIVLSNNVTIVGCKSYHSKVLNYQVDSSEDVTINSSESVGRATHIQRSSNVVIDIAFSKVPPTEDPLWIFNNAKEVTVKGSIKNEARYGIQVGSTTTGHLEVGKININCDIESNGEFCIISRANVSELIVDNSRLNAIAGASLYVTAGASKIIIKNNNITGNINNNAIKNVVIKDNVGSFSILNTNTTDSANGRLIENNHIWVN